MLFLPFPLLVAILHKRWWEQLQVNAISVLPMDMSDTFGSLCCYL